MIKYDDTEQITALRVWVCLAELYAWLTVFVLPINSAVNPLIYTVMTPSFKRRLIERRRSQATNQPNNDTAWSWLSLLAWPCFNRLSKDRFHECEIQM